MASQATSNSETKQNLVGWTQQDDAEYNRLAIEMNEDAKLQFTFFTFAITTTTAVLSILATKTSVPDLRSLSGLPPGLFFLTPLIILVPTSLLILNRARTRNRKAAYIIVSFEYKRLAAEGVTEQTSLGDVRQLPFIPWETALHILDRTNKNEDRRVHLAPAFKYMAYSYGSIEILCILLAVKSSWIELFQVPLYVQTILGIIAVLLIFSYVYRWRTLWTDLKSSISVQGYVEQWLKLKFHNDLNKAPRYLREWLEEYNYKKEKPRVSRP